MALSGASERGFVPLVGAIKIARFLGKRPPYNAAMNCRSLLRVTGSFCAAVVLTSLSHAQTEPLQFLSSVRADDQTKSALADARQGVHEVSVTAEATTALFQATTGRSVVIALNDRQSITLVTEKVKAGYAGARTWVGRDTDPLASSISSYITELGGVVTGTLVTKDGRYEIVPTQRLDRLEIRDLAAMGLSRSFTFEPDAIMPPSIKDFPEFAKEAEEAEQLKSRRLDQKAKPTPQTTIDLMVLYTPGLVTQTGSVSAALARINTLVQYANTAYENSEVAITLRLVHTAQVSYPETGGNNAALYDLTGWTCNPNCTQTNPVPALHSTASSLRNTYGADLVVLLRPYSSATHGGCGVAWIFNDQSPSFDAQFGYGVVGNGSNGGSFCAEDTFAHELGHGMGLLHDRPVAGAANGGGAATSFSYGYGFQYPSNPPTQGQQSTYGDIMSYAQNSAQYFSSPNVRCTTSGSTINCQIGGASTALGVAGDTDAGACTTNPPSGYTGCADGARTLNLTRAKIAAFRATVGCPPPRAGGTTCNLDVDGNGSLEAAKDGVLILRRLFGFSGAALTAGTADGCATRTSSTTPTIETFIDNQPLDVDASGGVKPENALTDGLLILRAMLGLTGTAVTNGLTTRGWDTGANNIKGYLNTNCGMGLP
jgi:Metallo-peptidase family M12B Reprolysin-like